MNRRNLLKIAGLLVFAPLSSFGKVFENKSEFRYFKAKGIYSIMFVKITNNEAWVEAIIECNSRYNKWQEISEKDCPKLANYYKFSSKDGKNCSYYT